MIRFARIRHGFLNIIVNADLTSNLLFSGLTNKVYLFDDILGLAIQFILHLFVFLKF